MTGMMSKIKGKLLAGWNRLRPAAPEAPDHTPTFSAQTLYYLFNPRKPVSFGAMNKSVILEDAQKIEILLMRHTPQQSPDYLIFLMAFREFQGAIKHTDSETNFSFSDDLLILLHDHAGVIAQSIDNKVANQRRIRDLGGVAALQGQSEIKQLQKDIESLTHFNHRIGSLFEPGNIAEKSQQRKRDIRRKYSNHSPTIPQEWRM